jgi:Tfp pilus assembly PilM family ATPase
LSKEILTLSIHDDSIQMLLVKGKHVDRWGAIRLEPGAVKDGLISNPEDVSSAITRLLLGEGIETKKVIVSLSGIHSIPRFLELPKLPQKLLAGAILQEAKNLMPMSLDELYLSWQPTSIDKDKQQIFILGLPRDMVDVEVKSLRQSGLTPYLMDLEPLALARAVGQREALIINVEVRSFAIVIMRSGIPKIMRTIPLSDGSLPLEERIGYMEKELERTFKFYENTNPNEPLDPSMPCFITGRLSTEAKIRQSLEEVIRFPLRPLPPPLRCPPQFPFSQYAVNVGLALKQVSPSSKARANGYYPPALNLNILPPTYRPRPRSKKPAFIVAGAVAGIALLFFSYRQAISAMDETTDLRLRRIRSEDLTQQEKEVRNMPSKISGTPIATFNGLKIYAKLQKAKKKGKDRIWINIRQDDPKQ